MSQSNLLRKRSRKVAIFLFVTALVAILSSAALAHPLGNFTINHYSHIEAGTDRLVIRTIVDMAEIPAFQELQLIDKDSDGTYSTAELNAYLEEAAKLYAEDLLLEVDGTRTSLQLSAKEISLPPGAGGLSTLRVECTFSAALGSANASQTRQIRFENANYKDRLGWREIVIVPAKGISVFDSTAYANGISDELKAYPENLLSAPLDERTAEFSMSGGIAPAGSKSLMTREGKPVVAARDRLAELIAVPEITPQIAMIGLLVAIALGGLHAMSPGHGKTIVGAYLVGSRGTWRHALFLGVTVTITHTLGVFALGIITLFASQYVVPEKLFPILSLASGLIVVIIGLTLFTSRLRSALGKSKSDHSHNHHHNSHDHAHDHHHHSHDDHAHAHSHSHNHHAHDHGHSHTHDHSRTHDHSHSHDHDHAHHHDHDHSHTHDHIHSPLVHSHGGSTHSHMPPGADGSPVTWKSLLALGVSGGLLPCPSALVVLLSAISLNRVGYGLLLVVAFSLGLAATLTAVGLLFLYAGRLMKRPASGNRIVQFLPIASALIIILAGLAICYEALRQAGLNSAAPLLGFISGY
jgi:ABC-type nickel/cobalt efflux system permease component RcnA